MAIQVQVQLQVVYVSYINILLKNVIDIKPVLGVWFDEYI